MSAIKRLWKSLFADHHRALDKRRLESLLRDEGLTRSESRRIVYDYFIEENQHLKK